MNRKAREIHESYNDESVVSPHSGVFICDEARRCRKIWLVVLIRHMTEA